MLTMTSLREDFGKGDVAQSRNPGSGQGTPAIARTAGHVLVLTDVPLTHPGKFAVENRILRFEERLREHGLEVAIVTPAGALKNRGTAGASGMTETHSGKAGLGSPRGRSLGPIAALRVFRRGLRLAGMSRTGARDIILFQSAWIALAAMMIEALRPEIIVHFDVLGLPGSELPLSKFRFWQVKLRTFEEIFKRTMSRADVVTTINATHARLIKARYGRDALVIPDLPTAERLKQLLELSRPPDTGGPTVLYVGSISRSRLDLFPQVAEDLAKLRTGLRFIVVGDGEDLPRYRGSYGAAGIEFPGYEGGIQLVKRIRSADVCYSDVWSHIGTPAKLVEYMAAAKPVVARDTESTWELIRNGVEGILYKDNRNTLRAALESLLDDPDTRTRLGIAARERVPGLAQRDGFESLITTYAAN